MGTQVPAVLSTPTGGPPNFKARGKAKADAREAKWRTDAQARQGRLARKLERTIEAQLARAVRKAGDHGKATMERLKDFIADLLGNHADAAEAAYFKVAQEATRQVDAVAWINHTLNEAEAQPRVAKAWAPVVPKEEGK